MTFQAFKVDEIYFGVNYCLAQSGELRVSLNNNYLKRINAFLDVMEIENKDCLEYEISQNLKEYKSIQKMYASPQTQDRIKKNDSIKY